jgi:hypothetical protein
MTIMLFRQVFGFLNIEIENKGKTLVGTFHSNDGNIIDRFKLNET